MKKGNNSKKPAENGNTLQEKLKARQEYNTLFQSKGVLVTNAINEEIPTDEDKGKASVSLSPITITVKSLDPKAPLQAVNVLISKDPKNPEGPLLKGYAFVFLRDEGGKRYARQQVCQALNLDEKSLLEIGFSDLHEKFLPATSEKIFCAIPLTKKVFPIELKQKDLFPEAAVDKLNQAIALCEAPGFMDLNTEQKRRRANLSAVNKNISKYVKS